MRGYSPYRQSVAAVLLLLYVFVATPVQLWHKHSIPVSTTPAAKKQTSGQHVPDGIVVSKAVVSADNCSICSHEYTPYNWDESNPGIVSESICTSLVPALYEPLLQVSYFLFSNKSPPATA